MLIPSLPRKVIIARPLPAGRRAPVRLSTRPRESEATLATTPDGIILNHNCKLKVFSGRANVPLAERIANYLNDSLGKITLANFPDGEISVRIDEDVRGRDVYIVQST